MDTTSAAPLTASKFRRIGIILFRVFFGLTFCFVALMAFCAICLACKARNDLWKLRDQLAGVATTEQVVSVSASLESFQTMVVNDYNLLAATVNDQSKILRELTGSKPGNVVLDDVVLTVGFYRGTCTNLTHAVNAPMTITFTTWADGKISGVLHVDGIALSGGGKFEGVYKENRLSFVTHGEEVGIAWNGVLREGRLTGGCVLSRLGKDEAERGTWSAEAALASLPAPVDATPPGA